VVVGKELVKEDGTVAGVVNKLGMDLSDLSRQERLFKPCHIVRSIGQLWLNNGSP